MSALEVYNEHKLIQQKANYGHPVNESADVEKRRYVQNMREALPLPFLSPDQAVTLSVLRPESRNQIATYISQAVVVREYMRTFTELISQDLPPGDVLT